MKNAHVYEARVVDFVDWSPAGWCTVYLRFANIGVPIGIDTACVVAAPEDVYPAGSLLRVAIDCHADRVGQAEPGTRIRHAWTLNLGDHTDEPPFCPARSYELQGRILDIDDRALTLDCGLVIGVVPSHSMSFNGLAVGGYVLVKGSLYFSVVKSDKCSG